MMPKIINKKEIYLDHAATTYMKKEVADAMTPYFIKDFGNPSALYNIGRKANGVLNDARRTISKLIKALPENIIFTGGGTESDNLAIYGIAKAHKDRGDHIISIGIEHHAVIHPLQDLEKQGFKVSYIPVDKQGFVNPKDIFKAITKKTILISIMYANNEIGTIEPIAEIGKQILKYRKENNSAYPYFHTDACQAAGCLDLDVEKLHVDLMTINGSKMYGPKGVGMLYIRRGIKIESIIKGGAQERRLRAGTENVASIIGLAKAFELAQKNKKKESKRISEIRNYLFKKIEKNIPDIMLNGPEFDNEKRLANNLNITFLNIEGEALLLYLDEYGIMCSTGSACTSDNLEPSHVLTIVGLPYEYAHGSLRFSFGACNSKKDVDYVMKYLPGIVEKLRELSPVNLKMKKHARFKN